MLKKLIRLQLLHYLRFEKHIPVQSAALKRQRWGQPEEPEDQLLVDLHLSEKGFSLSNKHLKCH